jgi:hypothetical protein
MLNIRSSMLTSYCDCPRRAAAKQWRKMLEDMGYTIKRLPFSIGAAIGTSVHVSSKLILDNKKNTGVINNVSESIDLGISELDNQISEGIQYDSTTQTKNEAQQQIQTIIWTFGDHVAPTINPRETEIYRKAQIEPEITFDGSCDIETSEDAIIDTKSGARLRPCQAQLGGYSILKKSTSGTSASAVSQNYIPRTAVKKTFPGPINQIYDVGLCERAAFAMIHCIARDVKTFIKTQNPWSFPANPTSMLCSEKWCPAYKTNFCDLQ